MSENRRHSVHLTLRLTPEEYKEFLARCESCEPPATPTSAIRWLIAMWCEEGYSDKRDTNVIPRP